MRHIGDLPNEQLALRFRDYLLTLDVKGMVEPDDGGWAVWVYDEDDVERARDELATFQDDPEREQYQQAPEQAQKRRQEELRQLAQHRKNTVDVRQRWQSPLFQRSPVTAGLILISVAVAAFTSSFDDFWHLCDRKEPFLTYLFIVPVKDVPGDKDKVAWDRADEDLRAIRHGQVHRLVTPIFIHFHVLHLLFNMLWLRMLGGAIEMRRGSWRLALMVLFIAVTSNLAQYYYNGPAFGGMSGVDFGLFGYLWMKSRYEPESGFYMPPQTVFLMIAWMVYCYFGQMSIANTAHTVGLIAGCLLGLWGTFRRRALHRR